MRIPAATIWDTKIQCVCSAVSVRDGEGVELWMCGNFGQVTLSPPRVIVNPNRLYPVEAAIRRERRFAINVFPAGERDAAIRLTRIRRRKPNKDRMVGLPVLMAPEHGMIPYLGRCLRTLFCEVDEMLDTGDHTVVIARVLESRANTACAGERPLLYPEISGRPSRHPAFAKVFQFLVTATGAKDLARRLIEKRRGPGKPDLAANTYREGGQTEEEIAAIVRYGVKDLSRVEAPPPYAPGILRRKIGVCVVGVGQWGSFHCRLFREASPMVELYVCGRDPRRVARVAAATGARDAIIGLERALEDPRVEALSLALPHHLHAQAAQAAAAAGKHVLVEKPIATTLEDADAMIAAARRAETVLMVAEDMHFRPAVAEAAAAISRGDVGEPLYFHARAGGMMRPEGWKAKPEQMGGGVLMDIGVHYIRALRLLMGEPDRVLASRAMQINTKIGGEDSVQALCSSRYGWQGHLLLSWAGPRGHSPDIILSGDRGVLHLWPGAPYVDLYPAEPRAIPRLLSYVRPAWLAEKLMRPEWQRVRLPIAEEDRLGYLTEVREFLTAVAEGRSPVSAPEAARRDLEVVLCAYQALAREAWVTVPAYGQASP